MSGGGHACSAPILCCKTQDVPEDSHLEELGLTWGGEAGTKDGPVRTVSQSPSLLRARDGDPSPEPQAWGPRCGYAAALPWVLLTSILIPRTSLCSTGCCCLKV